MFPLSIFLLAAAVAADNGHEQANPLYRELRQTGFAAGKAGNLKLPPPAMADGLDAKAQLGVLKKLAGDDYDIDELTRDSQVAPHMLRIDHDLKPSDPASPSRGVDFYFICYGDLNTLTDKAFLNRITTSNQKDGRGRDLTTAELTAQGIAIPTEHQKQESYGRVVFTFLDKVELNATGRSFWSRSGDSVLLAVQMDPRFAGGPLANQWRPLVRDDEGKLKPGEPQPYAGAAYYVKFTKLAEPQGALFGEGHTVFLEPVKWFDGANLLRSKLPPVVQSQVRTIRLELKKASRKE